MKCTFSIRNQNFLSNCSKGLCALLDSDNILLLGGVQMAVESCMYIFIFLWTPVLLPAQPPLGMVFASFMVCVIMGSSIYNLMLARGIKSETVLVLCPIVIASGMIACTFTTGPRASLKDTILSYFAFLCMEVAFGMYFPASSYLK